MTDAAGGSSGVGKVSSSNMSSGQVLITLENAEVKLTDTIKRLKEGIDRNDCARGRSVITS